MYTREQFWKSIQSEINIIKHLSAKAKADKLDYRPTSKSRTTLELMQYLSASGSSIMKSLFTEDMKASESYVDFKNSVTLENFAMKMDEQEREMKEMFDKMSDEDLKKEFDFYGVRTKAEHLFELVLKGFAAYRMQLFVYLKTSCDENLNTYNVWVGMDQPNK